MSTRYVWEKYNIEFGEVEFSKYTELTYGGSLEKGFLAIPAFKQTLEPVPNFDRVYTVFATANENKSKYVKSAVTISCSEYPYIIESNVNRTANTTMLAGITGRLLLKAPTGAVSWQFSVDGSTLRVAALDSSGSRLYMQIASPGDYGEGSINIGKVSSNNSGTYPHDGADKYHYDYWYSYLGFDTIDPSAITYSDNLHPGDEITVSITPSAGNTYGGSISYLYQYRINNGSWIDVQTTTATSIKFTIPASAATIQFRARANDDIGFVSTDYVTTASIVVERMNAWVGVNGKARKCTEMYVGVNGKARKVVGAWVGVNGKARRFL